MKKTVCPSCGAVYDGRKCKVCYYQPLGFDGVQGESAAGTGKTARRSRILWKKKQKTPLRSFLGFLIILVLIGLLLPVLRDWGREMEAREEAYWASQVDPENRDTEAAP